MKIRKQIERFRAWQRRPQEYPAKECPEQQCPNCGQTFAGNYCPVCGQARGSSRITWKMVGQNIMDVWGIGSRSLPKTVWHLMWRPGYFIGDYLDGHRRASYSPANMLFIMAIFYSLVDHFLGQDHTSNLSTLNTDVGFLSSTIAWLAEHPAWGMLSITVFFILPTWFFFRFAPRRAGVSFAEVATIQLFMSTLMLITSVIRTLVPLWFFWLSPLYYYIAYRQLFNYGCWSTLWRLMLGLVAAFLLFIFVAIAVTTVRVADGLEGKAILFAGIVALAVLAALAVCLALGFFISRWKSKAHRRPVADPEPDEALAD